MRIRFFHDADYAPLSRLLTGMQANPTRAAEMTPERLRQELASRGNNPFENFLVLETTDAAGRVVGFCGYQPLPQGRALMEGPVLEEEWRGQGWATRLFQELSAVMNARGVRTVNLVLGEENERGEKFAARQGFRHEKTEVIVVTETRTHPPTTPPVGIRIELAGSGLDLVTYEDLHGRLFTRRSPAYVGLLARMPNYRILVAREGNELVGFLELEFLDTVATIEAFGVAPEHRRRGIGRALLAAALDTAWEGPGTTLVRQIWNTTEPGYLKVYLEMGFTCKYAIRGMVREVNGRQAVPS